MPAMMMAVVMMMVGVAVAPPVVADPGVAGRGWQCDHHCGRENHGHFYAHAKP
jgi:hypothetical protein